MEPNAIQCDHNKRKGGFTVDWNTIKAEYIAGGISYRELAEKYGVSESTLKKKAAKEKWTELRNQAGTETELKIVDTISEEQADTAVSAVSLINDSAMNMLKQIADETAKGVNANKIKAYSLALNRLKDVLNIKSDIDEEEQRARINNLNRQAEKDNTDKTVALVLDEELEEYAL